MENDMPSYPEQRRAAVLSKLLPPHNRSIPQVAREEGISTATLYNWRSKARQRGAAVPGSRNKTAEQWSGEAKLAVVLETASLNEEELGRYCRSKGLYPEQIARWKQACVAGADHQPDQDDERTKHWRKVRRCWCYKKSSKRCGRTRTNDLTFPAPTDHRLS